MKNYIKINTNPSFRSEKGGFPVIISITVHPKDQISENLEKGDNLLREP